MMEHLGQTTGAELRAPGHTNELNQACMEALLAMSHYAEHPSDANEYELEIALLKIKRLKRVYRWRGNGGH